MVTKPLNELAGRNVTIIKLSKRTKVRYYKLLKITTVNNYIINKYNRITFSHFIVKLYYLM